MNYDDATQQQHFYMQQRMRSQQHQRMVFFCFSIIFLHVFYLDGCKSARGPTTAATSSTTDETIF